MQPGAQLRILVLCPPPQGGLVRRFFHGVWGYMYPAFQPAPAGPLWVHYSFLGSQAPLPLTSYPLRKLERFLVALLKILI